MERIGTFRDHLISGTVWKETPDANDPLESYWIELRNGRCETVSLHLNQVPELVAVLEQAARCVQDEAPDCLKFEPDDLFAATPGAERPGNP